MPDYDEGLDLQLPVLRPGVPAAPIRLRVSRGATVVRLRWKGARSIAATGEADADGLVALQPDRHPAEPGDAAITARLEFDRGAPVEIELPVESHPRETPPEIPTSTGEPTTWWQPEHVPEEDLLAPPTYDIPTTVPPGLIAVPVDAAIATAECGQPVYPLECSAFASFAMGDPVFAHNGEHAQSVLDLSYDNPLGPPVRFIRTYRSQKLGAGILGPGWDHSYNQWVHIDLANGRVTFFSGTGRSDVWTERNGAWEPPRGVYADLEIDDAANELRLLSSDGTASVFDTRTGLLSSVIGPSAGALQFEHDPVTHRLIEVRDALWHAADNPHRVLRLAYESAYGQLASVSDFAGRKVEYFYYRAGEAGGAPGWLKAVRLSAAGDALQPTVFYTYDSRHHVLASVTGAAEAQRLGIRPIDLLTGDERARLVDAAALFMKYDDARRVVTQRLGAGGSYRFAYGASTTQMFDPAGNRTTFEFSDEMPVRLTRHTRGVRGGDPYAPFPDPAAYVVSYTNMSVAGYEPGRTTRADGTVIVLEHVGAGAPAARFRGLVRSFRALDDASAPLTKFSYDFDANPANARGLVTSIESAGEVTTFAYDAAGRLVRVTNPPSQIVDHVGLTGVTDSSWYELGYDTYGMVERRDSSGLVVRAERITAADGLPNDVGRVRRLIVNPQAVTADPALDNLTYEFRYHSLGYVTHITAPDGTRAEMAYDAFARLRRTTRALDDVVELDYDACGRIAERRRLSEGQWWRTRWTYDRRGLVTTIAREVRRDEFIKTVIGYDGTGRMARWRGAGIDYDLELDERGLVYTVTLAPGSGAACTYRHFYDAAGRLILSVAPGGALTHFRYDGLGRHVMQYDDGGAETRLELDDAGRVIGLSVSERGAVLRRSLLRYDARGRVVWRDLLLLDASGQEQGRLRTSVTYNAVTGLAETVRRGPLGGAVWSRTIERDALGRAYRVTDSDGTSTALTRDAAGRVIRTRSDRLQRDLTYDARGGLTEIRLHDGAQTAFCRFAYDAWNRRIFSEAPDGDRLRLRYDGVGRLVEREEWSVRAGSLAAAGDIRSTFQRDEAGRLVAATDPDGATTTWVYDELGRVIVETRADGSSQSYGYHADGSLAWHRRSDNTRIEFTYDRRNAVVSLTCALPAGRVGATRARYQVELGRIVRATNEFADVTRRFDTLGQLVEEQVAFPDGQRYTTRADWSLDGLLQRLSYPGGADLVYQRATDGTLAALVLDGDTRLDITRDNAGITTVRRNGGVTTEILRDARGRVLRLEERATAGTFGQSHQYADSGLRVGTTWLDRDRGDAYAYDAAGRLVEHAQTGADSANTTRIVELSAGGARERVREFLNQPPSAATVVSFNRTALHACTQAGATNFSLWRDGARASDGARQYAYDLAGRLSRVSGGSGEFMARRDALGRIIESGDPAAALQRFAYFGEQRMAWLDASGVTSGEAFWGDGLDELHVLRTAAGSWYLHRDVQNNVVAASDAAGNVVERYEYDVDGAVRLFGSAGQALGATQIGNPFLFRARPQDPVSGLVDFRNRVYDPATGCFLTPDPTGLWRDASARGNGFIAFGCDPINANDPFGLDAWDRFVGGLQVFGGVLEIAGGVGLLVVPEPTMVTKAGGVGLTAHGIDTMVAGVRTLWNGKVAPTATQVVTEQAALGLGASPQTAERLGMGVDTLAGVGPSLAVGVSRRFAIASAERAAAAGADDGMRVLTIGYVDRGLRQPGHLMVGMGADPDAWRHLTVTRRGGGLPDVLNWSAIPADKLNHPLRTLRLPYAADRTEDVLMTWLRMGDEIPRGRYGVFRWNCVSPVAESMRAANIAVPWTFGIQKSRLYFQAAQNGYLVIGGGSLVESGFTIDQQLEDPRPTIAEVFND